MSAVRLSLARLASLVAFASLSLIVACTKPTPLYCTGDSDCIGYAGRLHCKTEIHTCIGDNTAVDADDGSATGDATGDKPTDGGTGEDHASGTDGPRGDAADGGPDAFHGCVNNLGCPDPSKHVCQVDAGVCVGCLQSGDCTTTGARACDTTANKCVECVVNGDCADPTKPVCDQKACRGCKADSECAGTGPGVCMFHLDGHCATDSETVYVAPTGAYACSDTDPAAGTNHKPFCHSQPAIDATAPVPSGGADGGDPDGAAADGGVPVSAKTLVVMRGPSLNQWSFNDSSRTITVVGQLGATLVPSANVGIHISAGTVYIRNLRVTGMGLATGDPAILAEGGSVLHLDRSMVDGNMSGGILIDGAAYDITNTVIANNAGTSSACGGWGGVCIANQSSGAIGRFINNTVVGNSVVGVACDTTSPAVLGSIVTAPNGGLPISKCAFTACCGNGAVGVDPTSFHLIAGSSCIDQLPANMSTTYDIDGDPRPHGTLSDCGADEYTGP